MRDFGEINKAVWLLVRVSVILAGLLFLASSALIILGHWYLTSLQISMVSVASISIIYFVSEITLLGYGLGKITSVALTLLFANAFIWSFEIIYHFTFPGDLNNLQFPFVSGSGIHFFLARGVVVIPSILILRKYLHFTKYSLIALALFIVSWSLWILYGFPQYLTLHLFYPAELNTTNLYLSSLWLNFGSKALLAALFLTLINPKTGSVVREIRSYRFFG